MFVEQSQLETRRMNNLEAAPAKRNLQQSSELLREMRESYKVERGDVRTWLKEKFVRRREGEEPEIVFQRKDQLS